MAALPPHSRADYTALLVAASGSWCEKFVALPGRNATYNRDMFFWMFNEDGTFTDDYKAHLNLPTGGIAAPVGVSASDGTYANKVTVSWLSVGTATQYSVWRSVSSLTSSMTQIGTSVTTSYDDTTATISGQNYFYAVKASNATATSDFSVSDSGYAQTGGGGGGGGGGGNSQTFNGNGEFLVPVGVLVIGVEMWAPGGGGGGYGAYGWLPSTQFSYVGGHGGGGGEYAKAPLPSGSYTGILVTAGETLKIIVGSGGLAGQPYKIGGNGGACSIVRASNNVALMYAVGGSGGYHGGQVVNVGGPGGTGGLPAATATLVQTRNPGFAGLGGVFATNGVGGATNPVATGFGTGGDGGHGGLVAALTNATLGKLGQIIITW